MQETLKLTFQGHPRVSGDDPGRKLIHAKALHVHFKLFKPELLHQFRFAELDYNPGQASTMAGARFLSPYDFLNLDANSAASLPALSR